METLLFLFEGAAADEFSQEAQWGNFVQDPRINIGEVIEGFNEAAGEEILGGFLRDPLQEIINRGLEDRQLIMEGGVEHDIRILLEGEDPFFLAGTDAGPHLKGLLRSGAAEEIIPDDAAEETYVGGADPVMVIQIQAGECGNEDLIDFVSREELRDHRIETVYAFQDDDFIRAKGHGIGDVFPAAGIEVKGWKHDSLPIQERPDRISEERKIQRVRSLQIHRAVRTG